MKALGKIKIIVTAIILVVSFLGTTAFADSDILKRGSKGSQVEELQTLLKEQGYFAYEKITGYFGEITEDSVKSFQRANDLKADGIVGEQTWVAIRSNSTVEDTTQGTAGNPDYTTVQSEKIVPSSISEGMEGETVEEIQKRLQELGLYGYSRITGYYGSITTDAVKSFQKAYGIKQDGVVGPQTMEKLFSTYKETSLIPGLKSDDVKALQERLKELGYYSYLADGEYGAKTREAVIYFQSANNLKADGVAGTQTKQILYSSAAITEQEARRKLPEKEEEVAAPEATNAPVVISNEGKTNIEQLIALAKSKMGAPYVYAADGPDTFDCSGFTTYIMKQFGVSLPRTAYSQGYNQYGVKITDKSSLIPGDLVFFNTNNSDGDLSDHVGIYLGNGDFIHASSGAAMSVVISNMNTSSYYKNSFSWGRRVLN